jgi:L-arabinonolactonase
MTAELVVDAQARLGAAVANSIAFSPDGSRLYFADSPTRAIHCADYDANGRIGAPRLFKQLAATEGYPDGSAVDADGGLWNAQWDGGCVVRYDSTGLETARLALPTSRPTCVAFGGVALDRLFVSMARIGLSAEALRSQPSAGGVFSLMPGPRGLPEHRFDTGLRA